ncbi:MAG: LysR substrate-binding domain-containing protein [Hoeflea sp.]|uniref:LysR substrate-binding domain-containing protein n=1 Tax=Hoeflea sp. TaxID=1940281 RepID=UPI002731AA57|nr:LysR substrate-binding domain-containing protein [Hoeflea sp.]MDP2118344.1 LysR substrate-binding domain-containing protein [Hoeflea sp.]
MKANLPFAALRTFESVVRLEGFGRAAEELGVTQSAVSQHVRTLEDWLGRRLVIRGGGRATANEDGLMLAAAVAAGFGEVAQACNALRVQPGESLTIGISCLPGFAFIWLMPRLIDFDQRYPDFPVSILTSGTLANFATDEVDVAIRYGLGNYPGLHVEPLMTERVFPVCAPRLLEKGPPIRTVEDLAGHTLLYDEVAEIGGRPPTWQYWAEETGRTLPRPQRTRRFGQSNMVVQAATNGYGVALGREPLVIDALSDGRLVRPFPELVQSQFSYWFVCPPAALRTERIRVFRDWLHHEVERQPAITDASLAVA